MVLSPAVSTIDRNAERIDKLQKEKIDDEKMIIQLKDEVVMKRSDEPNQVESAVQAEMMSYSLIVKKSLPTQLTRKTIEAGSPIPHNTPRCFLVADPIIL